MIFFVGIHNKPGCLALDSTTFTGKIIDQIIARLGDKCVKTNLVDMDDYPADPSLWAQLWQRHYYPEKGDVIVLLGRYTQKHFIRDCPARIIDVNHPASFNARRDKKKYIDEVLKLIITPAPEPEKDTTQ